MAGGIRGRPHFTNRRGGYRLGAFCRPCVRRTRDGGGADGARGSREPVVRRITAHSRGGDSIARVERALGGAACLFLSGGPGIPATALARVPVYFDLFDKLRSVGDVLLIDQRGSGMSLPNLTCPESTLSTDFLSSDDAFREALRTKVAECTRFWKTAGLDLRGYTTREIAADVDAVRRAVGAKRMKLLAFSYGSEVAFEIARRWPGTVERIVFASTRAPDTLLKLASVWDRQLEALGQLGLVREVVERLDRAPVAVQTPGGTFRVGGIGVLTLLRADLPDGRAIAGIPTFVQALRDANYATLTTRIGQLHASLAKSLNLMTLAVDCSSGWTAERLAKANAEAGAAVLRNVNIQWDPEVCRTVVGTPGAPPRIGPIDAPALFVTGTLDVNAPVAQTERIRKHFKTSARLLVVNGAHETLPAAAVQEQVLRFLSGARLTADTLTLP